MHQLLISIIIPVFNGKQFIKEAIDSVIQQTYNNIELIIIDGKSTDGTLEIVQEYRKHIKHLISEKDDGIYDAMNKGLALASGEWVYFLGADDKLKQNNTLELLFQGSNIDHNNNKLIFGDVINEKNKKIKSRLNSKILLHNTLHHQSCFYKKELFSEFRYNKQMKMMADYELNLIAYLNNYKYLKVNQVVAICRDGGVSTSKYNFSIYLSETDFIRNKYIKGIREKILKIQFYIKSSIYYAIRHS